MPIKRGKAGIGWFVDGMKYTEYQVNEWRGWPDVSWSRGTVEAARRDVGDQEPIGPALVAWLDKQAG